VNKHFIFRLPELGIYLKLFLCDKINNLELFRLSSRPPYLLPEIPLSRFLAGHEQSGCYLNSVNYVCTFLAIFGDAFKC
jgi:hypothetical protein